MASEDSTIYRGSSHVVDAEYGGEGGQTPVEAIVSALATASGVEPTELQPLYDFVDLDAVNQLFGVPGRIDEDAFLAFRVDSWAVFVHADGRIRVCDESQATAQSPAFESTA